MKQKQTQLAPKRDFFLRARKKIRKRKIDSGKPKIEEPDCLVCVGGGRKQKKSVTTKMSLRS